MAPKASDITDDEDGSSSETQFIPHSDDEELLWEVVEITAERGGKGKNGQYRVKWKGTDPKTTKPWPQSWVPKCDCTDDLVMEWKMRQRAKKEGRGKTTSKKPRTSTKTKVSGSSRSKASSSKSASTARKLRSTTSLMSAMGKGSIAASGQSSVDTVTPGMMVKPEEDDELHWQALDRPKSVSMGPPVPPPTQGTKRKREALSNHSSANHTRAADADLVYDEADEDLPAPKSKSISISNEETTTKTTERVHTTQPRKKRKIGDRDTPLLASSPPPPPLISTITAHPIRPSESATKPKPSKKRQPKRPAALTSDDLDFRSGDEVEPVKTPIQVEEKGEEGPSFPTRTARGRVPPPQETPAHTKILNLYTEQDDGNEEIEEKMVEHALSEVEMEIGVQDDQDYDSMDLGIDLEELQAAEDAQLRKALDDEPAPSTIVAARMSVIPKPRVPVSTARITAYRPPKSNDTSSSKSATSTYKKPVAASSKPPPIPEDSEEEYEDIRPGSPPPTSSATMKFGPPGKKTKLKKKKADTKGKSKAIEPPLETPERFPTREPSQDSTTPDRERAVSRTTASTPPPPLEWTGSSPLGSELDLLSPVSDVRRPQMEVSVFWGPSGEGGRREHEPILSPRSLKRLERFDKEMARLEREGRRMGKTKEKEQKRRRKLDKGKRKSVEEDAPVVVVSPPPPRRTAAASTTTATTTTKPPSIAPAAAAAKSPPPTRREGPPAPNNSFGTEIVPETDQSQSQSQELKLPAALLPLASTAVISTSIPPQPPTIPRATTPLRQTLAPEPPTTPNKPTTALTRTGSIKSRMKPRTPGSHSRASSVAALTFPAPPPPHLENKLPTLTEEDDQSRSIEVDKSTIVDISITSMQCTNGSARPGPAPPANDATGKGGAVIAGANTAKTGGGKTLKPIPMLSPSAFQPHLATLAPVSSLESAQESILDPDDDDVPKKTGGRDEDDDDDDAPMSSIEQFDSPQKEKGKRRDVLTLAKSAVKRRKGKESEHSRARSKSNVSSTSNEVDRDMDVDVHVDDDTPLRNVDVIKRGAELAEAAREREKLRTHGSSSSVTSVTSSRRAKLDFLVSSRVKSRSREVSPVHGYTDEEGGVDDEPGPGSIEDEPSEQQSETQSQEPPANNERSLIIQELENTYFNLGGVGPDPRLLRREEEESTQDLMMELDNHQRDIPLDEGWGHAPPAAAPSSPQPEPVTISQEAEKLVVQVPESRKLSVEPQISPGDVEVGGHGSEIGDAASRVPDINVERPSRSPSIRSYESFGNDGPANATGGDPSPLVPRLRSKSRSKSPAVLLPGRQTRARSYEPTGGQHTHTRSTKGKASQDLTATLSLLKAKSEVVSRLDNQLLAAQARNEDLDRQCQSYSVQLSEVSEASTSKTRELTQRLDAAHVKLATLNPDWETERDALIAKVEAATRAKASAESDREFFREQYAQASAYVGSVRDENKELEERARIAEGQATTGVNMIKATFETRTKTLEDSVKSWRRVAEFLMEKDRRTNDEIRRKAGEEPELRMRCRRQKANLEELTERMEFMEVELEEKERQMVASGEELQHWKDETLRLTIEVNEAQTKLERLGRLGEGGDADGDGHEFVYRCQWRTGEGSHSCTGVFLTISELQDHVYSGGHIQHS